VHIKLANLAAVFLKPVKLPTNLLDHTATQKRSIQSILAVVKKNIRVKLCTTQQEVFQTL
jgi:hypothetical protein